jgi:hypothetical protein
LGLRYTNSPDIMKMRSRDVIMAVDRGEGTRPSDLVLGRGPTSVLGFHGCGVLGLYHANTPKIVIHEIPFWIKVVVTLVGHMGKSSCLVLVFTGISPKKDLWLQV